MLMPALIVACLLIACRAPVPEEEQIRQQIQVMVDALSERNARAFMAPVADDFTGVTWNLDPRGARLLLNREMRAHEQLKARVFDIEITIYGENRASASMQAILTGGSGLIPDTGRWYRIDTGWRHDDGDWLLVSAEWDAVAGR